MANPLDFDTPSRPGPIPQNLSLLSSDESLCAGIRVTRAQFARMMGCSRQAVTDWVRAGRLTVGADGRFDPAKAVASLLRSGDPARLRAKVLQPMADELATYCSRIVELEAALGKSIMESQALRAELADAKENADFEAGAASEFSEIFEALTDQLPAAWPDLVAQPENGGLDIVIGWLQTALERGAVPGPLAALGGGEGEGEDADGTHWRGAAICQQDPAP